MVERTGPPPKARLSDAAYAARDRIDSEHRHLAELTARLGAATDLLEIEALLGELREHLREHFAGEEGPEGLHQVVSEGAAHRLPNLQHLFEEHRQILERIDGLRRDVRATIAGPLRDLREEAGSLAELLRRHESAEELLFSEAFYADIGGWS